MGNFVENPDSHKGNTNDCVDESIFGQDKNVTFILEPVTKTF